MRKSGFECFCNFTSFKIFHRESRLLFVLYEKVLDNPSRVLMVGAFCRLKKVISLTEKIQCHIISNVFVWQIDY